MLEPKELKLVLDTLSSRHAWLKKSVTEPKLAEETKKSHLSMIQILESATQKLSKITPTPTQKTDSSVSLLGVKRGAITTSNARVLIADDNAEACQLVSDILTDSGFKLVDTAEDGIQAFDKIKNAEEPFDIILCDWDMPSLSGLEIHQKAKASNTLLGAHFIMVTANSEASSIRKAIQQGINDYIVKPVNADVLVNKINIALGISQEAPKPKAQSQG